MLGEEACAQPQLMNLGADRLRATPEEELDVNFVAWQLSGLQDPRIDVRQPAEQFLLQLTLQPHFFDIMMKVMAAGHIQGSRRIVSSRH